MKNIVELLGKTVSFITTEKLDKKIISREESGIVTDVVLNVDGKHSICLNEGDFYVLSNLLEFEIA